jgi:hypothetical protein
VKRALGLMNDAVKEELAVLQSIYADEFSVTTAMAGSDTTMLHCKIVLGAAIKHDLVCVLGHSYPLSRAQATLSASGRRFEKSAANDELQKFVVTIEPGCPHIFTIASFCRDLLDSYSVAGTDVEDEDEADVSASPVAPVEVLQRQWLLFIGFYTKSIRTAFCQAAVDLGCTGFLMAGRLRQSALSV